MKRTPSLLLLVAGLFTHSAFAVDNTAWFQKVSARIEYGHHFGKTSNGKTCSLNISPLVTTGEARHGLLIAMNRTCITDIFGIRDKFAADIQVYAIDVLVGSSKYAAPYHDKNVTAFGYAKSAHTSSAKSVIVESLARGEVMITIETTPYDANGRAGKMVSDYCTFSKPVAH